jgi:Zn-dependent protease with chaperone function/Zn-finger nucleic acid-binding protein
VNRFADTPAAAGHPPPTTLFQVERDARWRIWALFGLLVVVMSACLAPLSVLLAMLPHLEQRGTSFSNAYWAYPGLGAVTGLRALGEVVVVTVVLGLAVAAVAWFATQLNVRDQLLRALRATPLDPHDTYHHRLANVVDELRIAAGLSQLDPIVIRALTVNAVSFTDPHGPACVGVTEGALSRLSRPQLQAVVAHEVAHVASRDCVVATRACLLFLGVRRIADTYGKGATIAVVAGYLAICFAYLMPLAPVAIGMFWCVVALLVWTAVWLSFWIATAGASVVDLALSRQREYAADAAAVRFTGDPASLAEALQMIEWQQAAAPAIPRVLAPLAIGPVGVGRRSGWRRRFETHPPLATRIGRLQALAHQQGQSLWERRVEVERRLKAREHAVPARAARGRSGRLAAAAAAAAVCPRCGGTVHELVYEGSAIMECPLCGGVGATSPQVDAILARRDWGFTPEQLRMADVFERLHGAARRQDGLADGGRRPRFSLSWAVEEAEASSCPLCEEPMRRAPWSLAYPLPAEYCAGCDLHWFDRDELEVLQILVERQTK